MKVIKIPFSFSNGGVSEEFDIIKVVEQKIIDVLITRPGDRAINSGYGLGIQSLLYEMINPLIFDDFKNEAIVAINDELESGTVVDISIAYPDSPEMSFVEDSAITINVAYRLPIYGNRVLSFNVTSDI